MKDLSDLLEQQRRSYERRLYDLRAQLKAQGGNIRSMDHVDLSRARDLGLVSEHVAEAEFAASSSAQGDAAQVGLRVAPSRSG